MTTPSDDSPGTSRSIELEVEVPGSPEQVWQAIATGPGVEAWFMPNVIEEREGGVVAFDMGFGMQETGTVSAWDPPTRFALAEEVAGARFATEFLVEARSGGSCVVRLVSSITGDGDFGDELDQMREGWLAAFRILQLYLGRFAGRPAANLMVAHETHRSIDDAWAEVTGGLGLGSAAVGERVTTTAPGAPTLAGTVDQIFASPTTRGILVVLDEPTAGVASLTVFPDGEHVNAVTHLYLYGDGAAVVAAEQDQVWRAWLAARFPVPEVAPQTG